MIKRLVLILVITLAGWLVLGCRATLGVEVERTPTPDRSAPATIEALRAENARLATRVAIQPTPAPPPELGKLAFVQGGDIWVKALPDGKPERLTTDGRNREPHWSPSGDWLAFRKDRELIVRRQTPCDVPRPTLEVCFDSESVPQNQLWLMRSDGSSARPLNQGFTVLGLAWAPTGDRLAYITQKGELQAVNADSANPITLLSSITSDAGIGQLGDIAWNPDGTWIAYEWRIVSSAQKVTYQGLWKISTDGRERIELFNSGAPKKGEALLTVWAPSGKSLYFWQNDSPTAALADGATLYTIGAEGQNPDVKPEKKSEGLMLAYDDFLSLAPLAANRAGRDLTAFVSGAGRKTWTNKRLNVAGNLIADGYAVLAPAWSPDGSMLAYSAMPERNDIDAGDVAVQELMLRRIWLVTTNGETAPRQLTSGAGFREERPLWSEDGSRILFLRMDSRGRASLWLAAAEGGASQQVADELTPAPDPFGQYGHVEWSTLYDWWRGPVR